jgi:VanZ family protein
VRTKLRLWGPVAAWMTVIFAASAQSDVGVFGRIPDWSTHGTVYLVLSVLVCRALAGGFAAPLAPAAAVLAVVLCTAYGISDEFHQSFVPGRDASAGDVAKDFGGSALGALLCRRLAPSAAPPARGEAR